MPCDKPKPKDVYLCEGEFAEISVDIIQKKEALEKVGVKAKFSPVAGALLRAFQAGKIKVETLKGFGKNE